MKEGPSFQQLHDTSVNLSAPLGLLVISYAPRYCCFRWILLSFVSHIYRVISLVSQSKSPLTWISSLVSAHCLEFLCLHVHSHLDFRLFSEVSQLGHCLTQPEKVDQTANALDKHPTA